MDKREFLKTSGAMLASTLLAKLTSTQKTPDSRTNWAGNYTYSTKNLDQANTVEDVLHSVRNHSHLKALGARHSFNGIADSTVDQISLKHFDQIELDAKARTVTVGAGVTYGQLAPYSVFTCFIGHRTSMVWTNGDPMSLPCNGSREENH